jgi:hypothetical protein
MSKKVTFVDYEGREIQAFRNADERCFIECTDPNDKMYSYGFVALDREDLYEFIEVLQGILDEMP